MQIRRFQESDRPSLRLLYLISRQSAFTWLDTSHYQLEDFDSSTQDEDIWVAEEGETLIGFVSIFREDNFIHNLYVDPKQPSRGIGLALLKAAEATFTSIGTLKCLVQNERALAFYLKNGWHIISKKGTGKDEYYLMGSGNKAV